MALSGASLPRRINVLLAEGVFSLYLAVCVVYRRPGAMLVVVVLGTISILVCTMEGSLTVLVCVCVCVCMCVCVCVL